VELVVSSSKSLLEKSKTEIVDMAVKELRRVLSGRARGEPAEINGD
jgi:hypothetical protein